MFYVCIIKQGTMKTIITSILLLSSLGGFAIKEVTDLDTSSDLSGPSIFQEEIEIIELEVESLITRYRFIESFDISTIIPLFETEEEEDESWGF